MKYLEFDIKNMTITRTAGDKTTLISGAVNYFGLHFNFDEEFASIPGAKAVEFFKNKQTRRVDLVDGSCAIPNELLADKTNFEMRVVSGNTIGTTWANIGITESGIIFPETPEEEIPLSMEYVKTYTGDQAAPLLRAGTNGLEYSQDGEEWNSGVSGVPEVPSRPKEAIYGRTNGDWVRIDKMLEELQEAVNSATENSAIAEVKVDGEVIAPDDGSVNIDLSSYAKKAEVEGLQTLTGTASQLTALDYSETDTANIISKINEIITLLQSRGIASE